MFAFACAFRGFRFFFWLTPARRPADSYVLVCSMVPPANSMTFGLAPDRRKEKGAAYELAWAAFLPLPGVTRARNVKHDEFLVNG